MSKKKKELEQVWVVVSDNNEGIVKCESFTEAEEEAESMLDRGDTGVHILEVVRAWSVEYPEEPPPDIFETRLSDL